MKTLIAIFSLLPLRVLYAIGDIFTYPLDCEKEPTT